MRNIIQWLEMPLLGKELAELADGKRTWVFRVLAVLGVAAAFLIGWVDSGLLSPSEFRRAGVGRAG
jgi:hypothetical protein